MIREKIIISAEEALERLKEGNRRFISEEYNSKSIGKSRREELSKGQQPFAIIVTCSDSRVCPEYIFDQGLGELFVIRVAGNVIDKVVMGSIEYAAEHLGTQLVVIMGHEDCGAVKATAEGGEARGSIGAIVEKILHCVERAKASGVSKECLCGQAENENIKTVVEHSKKSEVIKHLMHENKVQLVGAKYILDTGEVIWM